MDIKILGPGCMNCQTLHRRVQEAVSVMGVDAVVTKVEDPAAIVSYGVLKTPALVIDEQLVMYGRVPTVGNIQEIIAAVVAG